MRRFGRLETNLRCLWLICGDCDGWRRLLTCYHNHIATIIGSKYDCFRAAVEMIALIYKSCITRPLWVRIIMAYLERLWRL